MSRDDMGTVLDEGIRLASYFVEENGEFYPFGVVRSGDGEVVHVQSQMKEDRPASDRVIAHIVSGLREGAVAGHYLTTAIVSDVRLRDRVTGVAKDAIRVDLEDQAECPVTCYLPYSHGSNSIAMGELVAEPASPVIFC